MIADDAHLPPIYLLDDLRIDPARQKVERAGMAIEVGGLSFQLLRYLLEQGDRVVGFDELIERVWSPAVVNEETVTQRVKLLRQALGDDGRNPRYIRSVRGRGYQLCHVQRILERTVASASVAPAPARSRLAIATAIAFVIVALAAAAWWRLHVQTSTPTPASAQDELLQRARYYAGIGQADNNDRAIALFEEALRREPGDTAANVGLSRALSARMCLYNSGPESAEHAQALAEAVIARAPKDSGAHAALAYSFDCRGDIDVAIAEYEKAVALDPPARSDSLASLANLYVSKGRLADALQDNIAVEKTGVKLRFLDLQIARNLELLGFTAEAEQRYERLFRLYPDNVFGNVAYPRALFVQGRYTEAEAALAEALRRPAHPALFLLAGELALVRGERERATDMFAKASALRPHQSLPVTLVHLYAMPIDADWIAARAEERAQEAATGAPDDWLEVAQLRLARNDRSGATDALRRAVAGGFRDQVWLQTSPLLRALADEPAFADVVNAISRAVAAERAKVLAADWLPADLVNAKPAAPSG
jgi:DNA-binding winged helix-turn-helix (wHTH) protein/Tfp pilus assembly protein PilF